MRVELDCQSSCEYPTVYRGQMIGLPESVNGILRARESTSESESRRPATNPEPSVFPSKDR